MVKFKIVVLYPRLVLTLLLSAVKIISKSTITRLHHERQLKIQLHRPLGECNLKEFINITSSCKSLKAFIRFVVYYITEKIPNVRALIGTAVQKETWPALRQSQWKKNCQSYDHKTYLIEDMSGIWVSSTTVSYNCVNLWKLIKVIAMKESHITTGSTR